MPPARPNNPPRVPLRRRAAERLARLVPSRQVSAYLFVSAMPVLVGLGVGMELGEGWGLTAAGAGCFAVGWLLGAD